MYIFLKFYTYCRFTVPDVSKLVISPHMPPPFTAGTQMILSYTFDVSSHVDADSSISISAQWLKNGTQLSSLEDDRIELLDTFFVSSYTYSGYITISPLSMTLDNVNVACMVSLTSNLSHVLSSTTTVSYHPLITGEVVTKCALIVGKVIAACSLSCFAD